MRILRSASFAKVLLPILLAPFSAYAQEKSHVTSGQVDKAIREVEKLAQKEIHENALPGLAISVVFQDKVVYAKGFGVRDVSTKASVDADTVFQLASVSKPIGSTVVAELIGEGEITWDSVNDLGKWVRLQLANGKFDGKQIVNEKALTETHRPQMLTGFSPFTGLPGFYGLGWNVSYDQQGRLRLNHSGAFALGAATYVNLVLDEKLGVVVLTNAYPIGVAEELGMTFIDLALYGKSTQDWLVLFKQVFSNPAAIGTVLGFDYSKLPASHTPALKNSAYLGSYTNDFFGDISIVEKESGLAIIQGPKKKAFSMKHYDRDTFTYETEGENAVGRSGITFTIGPDGKATQVLVENLNVRGEGAFKRVPDQK